MTLCSFCFFLFCSGFIICYWMLSIFACWRLGHLWFWRTPLWDFAVSKSFTKCGLRSLKTQLSLLETVLASFLNWCLLLEEPKKGILEFYLYLFWWVEDNCLSFWTKRVKAPFLSSLTVNYTEVNILVSIEDYEAF